MNLIHWSGDSSAPARKRLRILRRALLLGGEKRRQAIKDNVLIKT
jgi:hypothetical protein